MCVYASRCSYAQQPLWRKAAARGRKECANEPDLVARGVLGSKCMPLGQAGGTTYISATHTHTRSQIGQDYPLNLSISVSGGKETNKDSRSNGE
jgi:hypothetical protein